MLKIYGHPFSVPARRVVMTAYAADLDFEYIQVNLGEGEQKTEAFLSLNPVGKVPVIDDDGFVLYESNAIMRYLARKNKSNLYPRKADKQALTDQWCDFISNYLSSGIGAVIFNKVIAPSVGMPASEENMQKGYETIAWTMPILNDQLKKSRYVSGRTFTIADISAAASLEAVEPIQLDMKPYKKISKWLERTRAMDFYSKFKAEEPKP